MKIIAKVASQTVFSSILQTCSSQKLPDETWSDETKSDETQSGEKQSGQRQSDQKWLEQYLSTETSSVTMGGASAILNSTKERRKGVFDGQSSLASFTLLGRAN